MKTMKSSMNLCHFNSHRLPAFALIIGLSYTPFGIPQTTPQATESEKNAYEKTLKRQQQMLDEQAKAIELLKQQINQLTEKITPKQKKITVKTSKPAPINKKQPPPKKVQQETSTKKPVVSKPVGKAPPESATHIDLSPIPRLSTNISGVLTKKGALIVEPSLGYAYNDSNRVFLDGYSFIPALVVGLIDLREIKRHTFIGSLSTRYGLTERWEVDLKIPVIGRNDRQRSRPVSIGVSEDQIFRASGEGLGDIELSTRYQLNLGLDGGPIYVANLAATIPTGTSPFEVDYVESTPGAVFPTELPTGSGYFSVQPSITALYPTDPGVLFGNFSYAYNFKTDEDVGEVDPGDSVGFSFGLGLSLNERTSMSLSYSHKHVLKSKIEDEKIDGSELDIGQLIIGYSFNYSQQTNINLSLHVGVTDDAQDVRLNFRLPMMY